MAECHRLGDTKPEGLASPSLCYSATANHLRNKSQKHNEATWGVSSLDLTVLDSWPAHSPPPSAPRENTAVGVKTEPDRNQKWLN